MVVTDLTMPGLTGTELVAQLRAIRPTLPALLTTGYVFTPGDNPGTRALPLLQKPFDREALLEAMGRELAGARGSSPAGAPPAPASTA
jgi:FixJ family two-component response regulator